MDWSRRSPTSNPLFKKPGRLSIGLIFRGMLRGDHRRSLSSATVSRPRHDLRQVATRSQAEPAAFVGPTDRPTVPRQPADPQNRRALRSAPGLATRLVSRSGREGWISSG